MRRILNTCISVLWWLYNHGINSAEKDIDKKRKARIFNIILCISILFQIFLISLVIHSKVTQGNVYQGISLITICLPLLIFTLLKIGMCRLGEVWPARIYIAILFGFNCWYTSEWGIDLPSVLLAYAIIIVITALILNTQAGFIVGILSALSICSIGYFQLSGTLDFKTYWKHSLFSLDDMIEYSFAILIISVLSWLANIETETSLKRAQASEKALEKHNQELEITLEERTKEMYALQAEKINDMYRFVEFGKISSGLFHDLASPLNALYLHTTQNQFDSINKQINPIIELSKKINSFVSIAKRSIQKSITCETFSVKDAIDDCLLILNHKKIKRCCTVHIEVDPSLNITGSQIAFHHIITNLLSNAFDSFEDETQTKEKSQGNVITISCHTEKMEHTDAYTIQHLVHISISDNGMGISEINIPHIFTPFFTTKNKESCGVGLSATKFMLEKYFDGKISVISKEQVGTTFTILLITKKMSSSM